MPSCVFKYCKNCSQKLKKDDGVSFHKFPTDFVIRDEWIKIIRESREDRNWLPSKFCVVCSLHFKEEDMYFTEKGRRLIKKKSKPTIYKKPISAPSSETKDVTVTTDGFKCKIENVSLEDESAVSNSWVMNEQSRQDTPIDSKVKDSDLDSMLDTPRESNLKKELRKHKFLRVRTQRKLKTLQGTVRRLKERNCSLKNILKNDSFKLVKKFMTFDAHNRLSHNVIATELFRIFYIHSAGKKEVKYSPAIRNFCLTLNFYSSKAYEYVRKSFNGCLPHPKTLAKWCAPVKCEPEFT